MSHLLEVSDLRVSFATEDGIVRAVDGVSFNIDSGEVVAIVGESGSGKSVTAMTLMGLSRSPNARFEGTAHYKGTELINASENDLRRIRGAEIAMIFQDPMTSLNPVIKIGDQIVEQIQEHEPDIVGFSAFLTTTMPMFKANINALEKAGLRDKVIVMVGGAPVTQEYADAVGADGYAADASTAVRLAKDLIDRARSAAVVG